MFSQILINALITSSVYLLVAVGFVLIYRCAKFFNFAHASIFTCGAYVAFLFHRQLNMPFVPAILIAAICATMLGLALEFVVFRPMRVRNASGETLMLASLGLYVLLQNAISMIWGDDTRKLLSESSTNILEFDGARITGIQLQLILCSAVLFAVLVVIISFTRPGRALSALSIDGPLARLNGISEAKYRAVAFALGSFLAAVAAVLIAMDSDIVPSMGFDTLVMAFIAVVVGGTSSVVGPALGALVIGLSQNIAVWQLPARWQDSVAFAILIAMLLFRPQGLIGKKGESS